MQLMNLALLCEISVKSGHSCSMDSRRHELEGVVSCSLVVICIQGSHNAVNYPEP